MHAQEVIEPLKVATPIVPVVIPDTVYNNCYKFVKTAIPDLPRMAEVQPNSEIVVGGVAIFYYNGVKHIALVTEIAEGGFYIRESNFGKDEISTRFIRNGDVHFSGVWVES